MKGTLEYNGGTYYINGAKPDDEAYKAMFKGGRGRATEEVDFFLAKRKHFAFHPKHLHEGYDDLAWINGFFHKLMQPSEDKVRKAMILMIKDDCGDGSFHRYGLKAGGGSMSDRIFSSSLSILISNPSNGEDQWVVLMKKYSTEFQDVLITYGEISSLFEMCATETQKTGRDRENIRDYISWLFHGVRCGKLKFSKDTYKPFTDKLAIERFKSYYKPEHHEYWEKGFNFFYDRIEEEKLQRYEEKPGVDINEKHRVECITRQGQLSALRRLFDLAIKRETVSEDVEQMALAL